MADVNQERELVRRRLLGWDIATIPILPGGDVGRDISLTSAPATDVAKVVGMDNLAQALTLAITTRLGDDIFNTNYGFDGLNALAEEMNPLLARERIRISIIGVLRRDPRIKQIVDVQLGRGALDPLPSLADRRLDVTVAFETIAGDTAGIDLLNGAISGG
jgi:hypothetical protein